MRTIIDMPEKDIKTLDLIAKRMKISRAEIIRKCVKHYLDQVGEIGGVLTHDIFGTFKDVFPKDSVTMQQAFREGWSEREDAAKLVYDRIHKNEDKP